MTLTPSRKWVKRLLLVISLFGIAGLSAGLYMFFKPHRNVTLESATEATSVTDLTNQFAANPAKANAKYLASDGNSSVLEVVGEVRGISRNMSGATVIVLSEPKAAAQVRCTMSSSFDTLQTIQKGMILRIKGAITAGNSYDSILQLQNDATLIECSIVSLH